MTFSKSNPVYLITDRSVSGLTHIQMTRHAISAGIKTVQLREKQMSKKDIYKEALKIREITSAHKVTLIINDYIDIALALGADGVHLGQEDMPVREARKIMGKKKIIGISTHTKKQAVTAQNEGADYIGFGPMFHTTTKNAGRPRGIRTLREIKKYVSIPIVAIGGIKWDNVNQVLDAGADAVAVASGILTGNIKMNIKKFFNVIKK